MGKRNLGARYCGAMSQENVEIVRGGYDAYARGDLDELLRVMDPALVTYREAPDGAVFHGQQGFLAAIAEWVEDLADFRMAAEEFIDANDHQVIVCVRQTAVGKHSGAPIEGHFWFVHTLSEGKLTRLDMLLSKERAREAAGLSV
jgi:ketosteroid isomerase-like protein